MGGTWSISPVNRASTSSSCARVTDTGRSATTSPVVSWVLVVSPSRSPATYSLSPPSA